MSTRFRQSDLQRALAAARKEGWEAEEIRIASTGEIVMRKTRTRDVTLPDDEDALDAWAERHGLA